MFNGVNYSAAIKKEFANKVIFFEQNSVKIGPHSFDFL